LLLPVVVMALGVPLVFHLWPELGEVQVLKVPLAWLLLGFGIYPPLALLGWVYVRRAERNERDFAELLETAEGSCTPRPAWWRSCWSPLPRWRSARGGCGSPAPPVTSSWPPARCARASTPRRS